MTTVYWDYYASEKVKWFELTAIEPTPALPEIIKARDVTNQAHFTRCPAFVEYYKNTYVLKSPIDIEFMYDTITRRLSIAPQPQAFYNANVVYRGDTVGEHDDFLMSFAVNFLFIADKDCEIELMPCTMHKSEFSDKVRLICGTFNINKWYRPVEVAFEMKDPSVSIKVKRGDALAYVKFIPADGNKIKMQHKTFSEETLEVVRSCLTVKDSTNKLPLKLLYALTERIRNRLWFNKKKCPFNWRK